MKNKFKEQTKDYANSSHTFLNSTAINVSGGTASQIVRDTGLTAVYAWAVAEDRPTWRALRPTAGE